MIHRYFSLVTSYQHVSLWSYYQERLQKYVLGHMDLGNQLLKGLTLWCFFIKVKSLIRPMKY